MPCHERRRRKACTSSRLRTVELTIEPRVRSLGEFDVRRILPAAKRRMVGPFVFLDHMGPAEFPPGQRHRRPPASAHRARDDHVFVRRRDRAPRQPGLSAAHSTGRREPHDGRPRHRALRARRRRSQLSRRACTASNPGSHCRSSSRRWSRRSCTTPPARCRSGRSTAAPCA